MKVTVFSGTGDGRELCLYLAGAGADVTACVATEYGAELMAGENLKVLTGRLDSKQMRSVINGSERVIDATHPYAAEASRNIITACREEGIEYIRLKRPETAYSGAVYADSAAEAVSLLEETDGGIFVSTGSKELSAFEKIGGRVTARVLDTEEVRSHCKDMNINRIIYKRPPFSFEDNLKDFKGSKYLVTKDGGTAGGLDEKLRAAERLSMETVIIKRPEEYAEGYTIDRIKKMFSGGKAEADQKQEK